MRQKTLGRPSKNSIITNLKRTSFSCLVLVFYVHSDNSFSPVSALFCDHKLQAVVTKPPNFTHIGQLSLISPSNIHPHLPTRSTDRLN